MSGVRSGSRFGARAVALVAVGAIVVGSVVGWAGRQVFDPARPKITDTGYTFVKVAKGSVGSSLSLNATSQWATAPVAANQASGVVTSVSIAPGATVNSGDVLYRVGLRPVVAIEGSVPSFRGLGIGTSGEDVTQLQTYLRMAGFYAGPTNGVYSSGTRAAVLKWQKSLKTPAPDGSTLAGDIVFIPRLPARLSLDTGVAVGQTLAGGEQAIQGLSAAPSFTVVATDAQAARAPDGTVVEVKRPDGAVWAGKISSRKPAEAGTQGLTLTGPTGGVLCADLCSSIPVTGTTLLDTTIVIVPRADGLVIPAGAIETTASGSTIVIDSSNKRQPVKVVSSAQGMSLVTGVSAGTRVRIPVSGE